MLLGPGRRDAQVVARLPTVVPPREGPRLEEGVTRFSTNLTGIGGQRQIIEP